MNLKIGDESTRLKANRGRRQQFNRRCHSGETGNSNPQSAAKAYLKDAALLETTVVRVRDATADALQVNKAQFKASKTNLVVAIVDEFLEQREACFGLQTVAAPPSADIATQLNSLVKPSKTKKRPASTDETPKP